MGDFLNKLLGADKEANLRRLSVTELAFFASLPRFKPSYTDFDMHTHTNRRHGKSDPYEPMYETDSLDREMFDRFNAVREGIGRKLGLSMGADSTRHSFYMDQASYESMVEYQRLLRGKPHAYASGGGKSLINL